MIQTTFADMEYQDKKRKTRRELFLERMEALIPWKSLEEAISPHYYPQGQQGRPPYELAVMLRVHCMQLFYNLSDPAMEDALYEIESLATLCRSSPLPYTG
jgi:IS5 family transposase